jgi:hypothetical protein
MILIVQVAALATLVGCDPEVGSLADCEPAAPAVDVGSIADDVPSTGDAELQTWLATGGYSTFLPESAPHASAGPHGGRVRTFVNRQLASSLTTCEASHPIGATAVKELFDGEGVRGWAVMIKTRPGPGADAWYWYEVFSTAPDAEPAISAQASGTCVGCHDGGLDAVRTRWPLR